MPGSPVGVVASLWRYPVKSMLGERREELRLDARGAVGDRLFAVRDEAGKFGSGKTTRRFRRIDGLFRFRARLEGELPVITFPDGTHRRGDDPGIHAALSEALGLPVTLSREAEIPHFDAGAFHLITGASAAALFGPGQPVDERRFRPNLVLATDGEGFLEDGWIGRELAVGDEVRLRVLQRTERCVMITFGQDELPPEPGLLRELGQRNAACFGVYAEIVTPGVVRVGDSVTR